MPTTKAESQLIRVTHSRDLTPADEMLVDVSLHRIWWRAHWMVWMGEPRELETHRPITHKLPMISVLAGLLGATLVSWTLAGSIGPFPFLLIAAAVTALLLATVITTTMLELRFWAWTRGNQDNAVLDTFRRPQHLLEETTQSSRALRTVQKLGDPTELFTEFATEHARRLRGWRRYNTAGWVRLLELCDAKTVVEFRTALDQWREVHEARSAEDIWEAQFDGRPLQAKRSLLDRFRGKSDPLEEAAAGLSSATRRMRIAIERAADEGLTRIQGLESDQQETTHQKTGAGEPYKERWYDGSGFSSLLTFIIPIPILAAVLFLGINATSLFTDGLPDSAPEPTSISTEAPEPTAEQAEAERTAAPSLEQKDPQQTQAPTTVSRISDSIQAVLSMVLPITLLVLVIAGGFILMTSVSRW